MTARELDPALGPPLASALARDAGAAASERMRGIVDRHYDFLWRSLRHLEVREQDVEDAAQRVLVVVSRRLDAIDAEAEPSFLFGTAMKVASEARRSERRRHDGPAAHELDDLGTTDPGPDELLDRRRAVETFQRVLDRMPLELRTVFVMFEIEEFTLTEISKLLGVPRGTVASRLRRSRELFQDAVQRLSVPETRGGR